MAPLLRSHPKYRLPVKYSLRVFPADEQRYLGGYDVSPVPSPGKLPSLQR